MPADSPMTITLSEGVWATVRSSLAYQRKKLAAKYDRAPADSITARRSAERVDNLTAALRALDAALGQPGWSHDPEIDDEEEGASRGPESALR